MKKRRSDEPKLEPPATFFISAAAGWMELGLSEEGIAELDRLDAPLQDHSMVLNLRWMLFQHLNRWDDAVNVGRRMLRLHPAMIDSWVHLAFAVRRAQGGGLKKARTILRRARRRFPREIIVPFNLACYECQLGRTPECLQWFEQVLDLCPGDKDREHWIQRALADPDLEAAYDEIKRLSGRGAHEA